jgi:hypothetical protein
MAAATAAGVKRLIPIPIRKGGADPMIPVQDDGATEGS